MYSQRQTLKLKLTEQNKDINFNFMHPIITINQQGNFYITSPLITCIWFFKCKSFGGCWRWTKLSDAVVYVFQLPGTLQQNVI